MPTALTPFLLALIPLFVAMDALAVIAPFLSLTEDMPSGERARTLRHSVLTALLVGVGFIALGRAVFHVLGITIEDFQIAGGAVLFGISFSDLVGSKEERRKGDAAPGVVPLGVPLIVGPAVLTTILISVDNYGLVPTIVSFLFNMLFAWGLLSRAELVTGVFGKAGTRGFAKVMSLLLAAIGVMMIRRGIQGFLSGGLG